MAFSDALKKIRKQRDMSQEDMAKLLGTSKQVISRYERGERSPKIKTAAQYAAILGVTWDQLNGDAPILPPAIMAPQVYGIESIPVVGAIACGEPILAEENIVSYVDVPSFAKADFALECKGDSMVGARILDGDLVCIRQQDDVTDGQIAAVLIDDEATLKRVYHNTDGTITLVAENSRYPPKTIGADLCENVRIIGLATHFISKVV